MKRGRQNEGHKAPEEIVQATVQDDVDVLGISILSGAHGTLISKVVTGLKEYSAKEDTFVLAGVVIPEEDREVLKEEGVAAIFGLSTLTEKIIEFVRESPSQRR